MYCVNPAAEQSVFCRFNTSLKSDVVQQCLWLYRFSNLYNADHVIMCSQQSLTGKRTPEHIHNVVMNVQVFHGQEHAIFCFTVA